MALYIAEIVTIVRHKKFHNSFYALFVMRAIPDLLYVLNSFYANRLPSIIGSLLYPIYSHFPNWMFEMVLFITGYTFQANNLVTIFILLNRLTAIIMPINHEKKVSVNGNNFDDIEKKLLIYAMATLLGHVNVACLYLMLIITNIDDPKTRAVLYVYNPLIIDTGTVMLSSCLLLWASGTFRQQLIKDFSIIRKTTNIQSIRVGTIEGPRNNNLQAVGGTVGHQLQNRFCSSVQQLATIS
ncbi:hypothetical protein GPALN_013307 [Globodera pallida]|nr:hypothetical protein GPALN_013307 [Globodera pallida]